MEAKQPPKFIKGDRVLFLGSEHSWYGTSRKSDEFIGKLVTIKRVHYGVSPYAYIFWEMDNGFWFSENCFEAVVPDLPEFEANTSLEGLF